MRRVGERGPERHGHAQRFDERESRVYALALARKIREAREDQDIAVSELAAATGIDRRDLHRLERGVRKDGRITNPKLDTLVRIARALGLSPSEILP